MDHLIELDSPEDQFNLMEPMESIDQDHQTPEPVQPLVSRKSLPKQSSANFMLPTAASKHRNIKESIHNKPKSEIDRTLGQPEAKRRITRKISQEKYS